MCILILSTSFVWNISHSKRNWARYDMYIGLHAKYPLFLSYFIETRNFLNMFSKNIQISVIMKIRPVGAELFHADGQTDKQTWRS